MTRTDMVTHMKENQTHHIQLLAEKVKEQNRQMEEQNRRIEELSMKFESKDKEIETITQRMKEELAVKLYNKDEGIAQMKPKQSFTSEPVQRAKTDTCQLQ